MPVDPSRLDSVLAFAVLSPEERERIAAASNAVEVPAGTVLPPQGDFGYRFFMIEDGTATVTDGGTPIAHLGAGDFFGEIGLLVTGRRTASVTATSPIRLLTLFDQDFRRVCADVPRFERVLREAMAERLGVNTPSQP